MVANLSELGNHTTIPEYFCPVLLKPLHKIIILSLNIPLFITAILGNVLIIVALQKATTLRPASKLLLGCLATTDLGVGVITHPILSSYLLSPEHSKLCYYSKILLQTVGSILAGVSLYFVHSDCNKCRQTSSSIVGTKLQTDSNFEKSLVLSRYFLAH